MYMKIFIFYHTYIMKPIKEDRTMRLKDIPDLYHLSEHSGISSAANFLVKQYVAAFEENGEDEELFDELVAKFTVMIKKVGKKTPNWELIDIVRTIFAYVPKDLGDCTSRDLERYVLCGIIEKQEEKSSDRAILDTCEGTSSAIRNSITQ